MVWYNLQVGKYNIKYTPLKSETPIYPYCDSEGNILNKVLEGNGKNSFFIDDKGNKHTTSFRLINGKPLAKLSKTKNVNAFKEVDKNEVEDLLTEKEYLVDSDFLLSDLKNSEKALKFGISFGGKSKPYFAIVCLNTIFNTLEMWISKAK